MGWGTQFKHDIFIKSKSFSSKIDIEDEIEDELESIGVWKQELAMLASMRPSDYPLEEGYDLIYSLKNRVCDIVDSITESSKNIKSYQLLLEYLEDNPDVDVRKLSE